MDSKKLTSRSLGFTDYVTILCVIFGYFILFSGPKDDWTLALLIYRFGVVTTLQVIRALLSEQIPDGLETKFEYIYQVIESKDLEPDEKAEFIRGYLEKSVERWLKYWRMFKEIVYSSDSWKTKWSRIKFLLKRIYKGEINWFQLICIYGYIAYSILIATNFIQITVPYDILINIGFLMIIYYASGNIIGLTELLLDIFKAIAPAKSKQEIVDNLTRIEHDIKDACKAYTFIDGNITKTTVEEKINSVIRGGPYLDKKVHLENLEDLQRGIERSKPELNHEIAALRVELEQKSIEPTEKT